MSTPILSFQNLKVSFGGKPLFEKLEGHIKKGEKYCLIGKNGSGKSTLLKVLAEKQEYDNGKLFIQPGLKIHYLPQDYEFNKESAFDFVMHSNCKKHEAEEYLMYLGVSKSLLMDKASGGEKRRVLIAKALCSNPDVLLLDEPTNHLDLPAIQWMEEYLNRFKGSYLIISHDRKFLENTTNKTFWLDRGKLYFNAKGYSDYDRWSEYIENEEAKELKKMQIKMKIEEKWLHRGVTARRKRNQGRLRALLKLREEKSEKEKARQKYILLHGMEPPTSSKIIIKANNISKKFNNKSIIKPFSIQIEKGDRIGIIGPNGSGKTTLVKMLCGILDSDSGNVILGKSIEMVYFDQMREKLDSQKSLWKNLTDSDYVEVQDKHRHVMGYLKDFMFSEKQIRGNVGILSGGEKNRLALAKTLAQKSNILVLDEPTNDLDMDTLDMLFDVLSEYSGTLILISHDRDFLDKITTNILLLKGDGEVKQFIGGYSDSIKSIKNAQKTIVKTKKIEKVSKTEDLKKKISYKEKYEFDQLTKEIEKLEVEIKSLEEKLNLENLFLDNPEKFNKLSKELSDKRQLLDDHENRWNKLSELFA